MDINDLNLKFGISLRKLRSMEKAGVLRIGKSQLPKHWQMLRSDIKKGKMSARSIALAYRYPTELDKVTEISSRQRAMVKLQIQAAGLPMAVPSPVDRVPSINAIICGAATEWGDYLERFIQILKTQIPELDVGYYYVAVRILLMCKNEYGIDSAYQYLCRALSKAKDKPEMAGWWHRENTSEEGVHRTIYHRPKPTFDL